MRQNCLLYDKRFNILISAKFELTVIITNFESYKSVGAMWESNSIFEKTEYS